MQHLFTILFLLFVCTNKDTFAQNIDTDTLKTRLIFAKEYGFVTMEEGMPFLLANSLIDTTSKSSKQEWGKINPADTIGKYYRIAENDNCIMLIPYSLDFFNPVSLIIEITSNGEIIKNEKFDLGGAQPYIKCYEDFEKYDTFFGVMAQGGLCFHAIYESI